jgi:hypothetical protein
MSNAKEIPEWKIAKKEFTVPFGYESWELSFGNEVLSCAARRHGCSYLSVKRDRKLIRSSKAFDWFAPYLSIGRNIPRQNSFGRDMATLHADYTNKGSPYCSL